MGLLKEFKEFAMRGNVVDLAVGVIIGASFGKIVSSLVADVITPALGLAVGGVDFKDLKVELKSATVDAAGKAVPAVTLNYGVFLQTVFDFLIIAIVVFAMIQLMNRMMRKRAEVPVAPPAPPAPTKEEVLLTEIRDALRARN
jgi:large conductance mechanosensitive channel